MNIEFGPATTPSAGPHPSDFECSCADPDDQYLLEIDCGSADFTHKACGKSPKPQFDDAFSMDRIPVTLNWHEGRPTYPDYDADSYGVLTVNHRAVLHDDVPYLVDRQYADRDGAAWHITELVDQQDRPLVFLLPEGAGEYIPLAELVDDFGPLTLVSATNASDRTVFTPTIHDMEASYHGVLVSSLAEGEQAIALTGVKERALEAIDQYYREVCGQPNLLDDADARLTDAYYVLDSGYAVFTRSVQAGWEVTPSSPTTPGAVPVTWFRGAPAGPVPQPYARRNDPTLWGPSL